MVNEPDATAAPLDSAVTSNCCRAPSVRVSRLRRMISAGGTTASVNRISTCASLPRGGAADAPAEVVGFVTSGRARGQSALADGEIETLYVLDDWRDRGLGRRLMQAAADHLADLGCQSVFLWVLRDNPSRWFYAALGGRPAQDGTVSVAGQTIAQTAYVWSPLEKLRNACADR